MPVATPVLSSFCIVADDLSGAADCAASFAGIAGPVPVLLAGAPEGAPRLAFDTDTRTMAEHEACAVVGRVFAKLGACDLVYKKIDSTLRGHVGAELAAALAAAPALRGAIVAPAFPRQGRTLVDGQLLVHGRPPQESGNDGDLPAMVRAAGLRPALLSPGRDPAALARRIDAALERGARAVIVDATQEADLSTLAAAVAPRASTLLVAGSAGLAHALAPHVEPGEPTPPAPRPAGAVLAVVGSFSAASAAQVMEVERDGLARVLRLTPLQWLDVQHADFRRSLADDARLALAAGRHVLLAIAGAPLERFSRDLVQAMARVGLSLLDGARGCVLTGGDTARALFEAAHIARLDVTGELEPGISIGSAPARPHCQFILKAGGFGDPPALRRAIVHAGTAIP